MKTMALIGIIASGLLLFTIFASVRRIKSAGPSGYEGAVKLHALLGLATVVVVAATLVINWITLNAA